MAFRRKMNRRKDRRAFSKYADRTNALNMKSTPMRGGFRI